MRTTISVVLAFLLTGCVTTSSAYKVGKDFNSELVSSIDKGKTNKSDLIAAFGEPFSKTTISATQEKWVYTYTAGEAKAKSGFATIDVDMQGKQKTLDVLICISSDLI